jgi:hypothetical protein
MADTKNIMSFKKITIIYLIFFSWLNNLTTCSAQNIIIFYLKYSFFHPLDSAAWGGHTTSPPLAMPLHSGVHNKLKVKNKENITIKTGHEMYIKEAMTFHNRAHKIWCSITVCELLLHA